MQLSSSNFKNSQPIAPTFFPLRPSVATWLSGDREPLPLSSSLISSDAIGLDLLSRSTGGVGKGKTTKKKEGGGSVFFSDFWSSHGKFLGNFPKFAYYIGFTKVDTSRLGMDGNDLKRMQYVNM